MCIISADPIYKKQDNYIEALKNHLTSLKIKEEIGDKAGIAGSYINIAFIEFKLNNTQQAKKYLDNGLELSKQIGHKEWIKNAYSSLSALDSATKNFKGAYQNYKLASIYKDSLINEEKSKEIGRLEMRHEYEMAEMKRMQEEAERRREEEAVVGRRNKLQYSGMLMGIFGLFVLVFFIGKFNLPHWAVELSVFIPFLILFEFLLVLLEPYIESVTGGEPVYKLLVNALLAAVIFPIHGWLEGVMKRRMGRGHSALGQICVKENRQKRLLIP